MCALHLALGEVNQLPDRIGFARLDEMRSVSVAVATVPTAKLAAQCIEPIHVAAIVGLAARLRDLPVDPRLDSAFCIALCMSVALADCLGPRPVNSLRPALPPYRLAQEGAGLVGAL